MLVYRRNWFHLFSQSDPKNCLKFTFFKDTITLLSNYYSFPPPSRTLDSIQHSSKTFPHNLAQCRIFKIYFHVHLWTLVYPFVFEYMHSNRLSEIYTQWLVTKLIVLTVLAKQKKSEFQKNKYPLTTTPSKASQLMLYNIYNTL